MAVRGVRARIDDLLAKRTEDDSIREALDAAAEDSNIPDQVPVDVPPPAVGGLDPAEGQRLTDAAAAGVMTPEDARARADSYIDPEVFNDDASFQAPPRELRQEAIRRSMGSADRWSPPGDPWTYELHTDSKGAQYILAEKDGKVARVNPGDMNAKGVNMFDAIMGSKEGAEPPAARALETGSAPDAADLAAEAKRSHADKGLSPEAGPESAPSAKPREPGHFSGMGKPGSLSHEVLKGGTTYDTPSVKGAPGSLSYEAPRAVAAAPGQVSEHFSSAGKPGSVGHAVKSALSPQDGPITEESLKAAVVQETGMSPEDVDKVMGALRSKLQGTV